MPCHSSSCGIGGTRLCAGCVNQVMQELLALPELYEQCGSILVRQCRPGTERVRGSGPGPVNLNHAALSARDDIMVILASWASLVVDERGLLVRPRRDATSLSKFLIAQLEWLADHQAAADVVAEIHDVFDAAVDAVDPGSAMNVVVGRCEQRGCQGVTRVAARGRSALDYQIRCAYSNEWLPLSQLTQHPVTATQPANCPVLKSGLQRVAERLDDAQLLPTELAAVVAGVPRATIRKWASRGKLKRHGDANKAMYDLREILRLASHTRRA